MRIALALCALAGLRVFLFAAAFPFFTNVDEDAHVDLVGKYAKGHVPSGIEPRGPDMARTFMMYGSPEYLTPPERFHGGVIAPPLWTFPPEAIRDHVDASVANAAKVLNHEATQPPLYYAVAGGWSGLGKLLRLDSGRALYWIRFLNVLVCVLLTWLAYLFARTFFPDDGFVRLGMPLLIALFPQDVLYSVNNDVLLPLAGGAAFFCLMILLRDTPRSYAFHAGTGLLVAAVLLVKLSGIAILPIAAAVLAIRILRPPGTEDRMAIALKSLVLILAAAAPLAAWGIRNATVLGDVTGSASKVQMLGWSLKPLGAMLDHPIFTAHGISLFWQEAMTSFWRGEIVWGLRQLASAGWDPFYVISSFVLPAAAVLVPAARGGGAARPMLWLGLGFFVLSLGFLGAVSIAYDFRDCYYPSRLHPFITSGRLVLAALLPFAALYLSGLGALLRGRWEGLRWVILITILALITISEISLSRGAFQSQYNWFHLR